MVIGKSGVGKSRFINAIRGMENDDDGDDNDKKNPNIAQIQHGKLPGEKSVTNIKPQKMKINSLDFTMLVVYDGLRWFTVVYGGLRWFTVGYGWLRWFTMLIQHRLKIMLTNLLHI